MHQHVVLQHHSPLPYLLDRLHFSSVVVVLLLLLAGPLQLPAHFAGEEEGFLVTAGGAAQGLVLRCSMEVEGALASYPTHKAGVTAMGSNQGGRLLVQGYSNGMVRVSEAELGSSSIISRQP